MGGKDGSMCPAVEVLPTLRNLHGVLFEGSSIPDFVEGMRLESLEDPAETLLSTEVQDGLAFIPTLLAPDAVADSGLGRSKMRKNLSEPFLSDDKLAAIGIDVESMDKFRTEYLKFRAATQVEPQGKQLWWLLRSRQHLQLVQCLRVRKTA